MNTYKPDATAISNWNITTTTGQAPLQSSYKEGTITYDRNGNILTYQRWGASTSVQDNLTYSYIAGTNKLSHVADAVVAGSFLTDFDGQSTGNYTYDGAGNLTGDAQSFISAGGITWNPYGKIMQVDILGGLTQNFFAYDATQNRVKKRKVVSGSDISTFYVRDAQGNVLAVYEKNGTTITWKEQHLYGSSRLGTVEPGVAWTTTPAATPYFRSTRILNYGWKRYEINDHLGNVRALINDRKTYGGATFSATLLDATDYFPFGAEMRKGTVATSYRYGFNGKELDKNGEFGSLNHYDYGFRIYNPGIAKFLSVDPLTSKYPSWTPYAFAMNRPIDGVDLDGLEYLSFNHPAFQKKGTNWLSRWWNKEHNQKVEKNLALVHSKPIVKIAGNKFYDIGDHLFLRDGQLSKKGQRIEQVTHATRVGIQLFANLDALPPRPADVESRPYTGTTNEETVDLVKWTYEAANKYSDCFGVCYATTATRTNKAYKSESGYNIFNLTPSGKNPDFTIMSTGAVLKGTEDYYGYGAGGALLKHGLGKAVDDEGVWGGKLQEGALLQIWHSTDPNNLYGNGGHSQIFRGYQYDSNGRISGLVIFDNSGEKDEELLRVDYENKETIRAVNLKDIPRGNH